MRTCKCFCTKGWRCVLAALLAATSLLSCLQANDALAAQSAELSIGSDIPYGGYATTWMSADGKMAYCANPSSSTPPAGSYAKSPIDCPSGRNQEVIANLWFSYGSEGFESGLWPSSWYDGSAMTDARYAALAHILISDTFTSDGSHALYGCNESFKRWCKRWVIGFDDDGEHADATGRRICARQNEVPSNFTAFMLYTGAKTQVILSHSYIPYGNIDLQKVSANLEMTENNPCYSRDGAVYTVYSNSSLSSIAGHITTNASGYGRLDDLMPGDYWIKETKSSPGYALDDAIYKINVQPRQTARVNGSTVYEIPQSDPVGMLLGKIDAATTENIAEGDATLAGVLFTVRYYKGDYSSAQAAESSGPPARTWVFETDADGFCYLSDEYKYSGDALYRQSNGDATIPLGTILVQETKAPQGYNLDDGYGGAPPTYCIRITSDGSQGENVYTYNSLKSPDGVKHGDFRLVKEVPVTIYSNDEGDSPQKTKRILVPGVKFEIYNDSAALVYSPETKKKVEPEGRVCTITVDENGLATTSNTNADVNGWSSPAFWGGALAYGTYRIHEVIPDDVASAFKNKWGKQLLPVSDWKTTIRAEGQYDPPALVSDFIPQTPLKIVKTDVETGRQIPLPCSFKLLDSKGEVITWTTQYPETQVMDTWSSNEHGELTLPMLLEEGDYTLIEVQAPCGYVKGLEGKAFHVGAEYRGWEDPLVVEFSDAPQKATISVAKSDSWTGEAVNASTYIVRAAKTIQTPEGTIRAYEDEIVATLVTDESGRATSPELYLGTYTLYEAKAKDGYALNVIERTVTLDYAGQDIAAYDHEEKTTNTPTEPKIKKIDALDPGKPVEGAIYRIWNDEGTFDEMLATNAEGIISLAYAKHGSYHIQEVKAPDDYAIVELDEEQNPLIIDFKVNDQGMIEWDESGEMAQSWTFMFSNMPKTLKTTATDAKNGVHEGQAREDLSIIDEVIYTGLIPGHTYTITGKLMDKETGECALDDDGAEITASTSITAETSCGTASVIFTFKGKALAGKSLVAFESLEHEDSEYMAHADIEDAEQTVNIVDISTKAHDATSSTHEGTFSESGKLIDAISYTGLTPGNKYKIFTTLIDKATGEAILGDDSLPHVFTFEFTPIEPDGTVDVEVEIDTTALVGKDIVFFEKLTDDMENIIAVHEDIEDENQIVSFPKIPGKDYPKTGKNAAAATSVIALLLCGSAGAYCSYIRHAREKISNATTAEMRQLIKD